MESTPSFVKTPRVKARLSDVVSTWITYRQKGVQNLVIQSLSILLSVTILFLLSQVYYIFLPCLKALLWALLCGSALYPFKIWLAKLLSEWLDQLDRTNRSLCLGCLMLPMQLTWMLYNCFIELMSSNLVLFVVFHFRYQIVCHVRRLSSKLLPMVIKDGHLAAIVIALVVIIVHFVISMSLAPEHRKLSRSMPSVLLMACVYALHYHMGIFGQLTLLLIVCMFVVGFIATIYNIVHGSTEPPPFDGLVNVFRENVRTKVENYVTWIRDKYQQSTDHIDGRDMNIGQLFITRLFTVSAFAIAEHMNVSNLLLAIVLVHLILQRMLAMLISDQLSTCIEFGKRWLELVMEKTANKFKDDILFRMLAYFFRQGDRLIKVGLRNSLDLLTSISLFVIVGLMVTFSTVFVSIKIYGECYQTIYLLQNELKTIEFIQESINITIKQISEPHYVDNLINDRLNLQDDEKIFINKMLAEFRHNILPWLNNSSNDHQSIPLTSESSDRLEWLSLNQWPKLWRLVDYKNFSQLIELLRTQASSYLPMVKSIVSVSYAFVFVILDSSTMLIIFLLALFYLLSSSQNKYKPIELMDHMAASLVTSNQEENKFSHYVEQVVNSIFAATIKISAFYGVYTWLLHSLFSIGICYIPAVIAAILAAVPLLNAYWASLPACLYLYYFEGNLALVKSLSMFGLAMLPSFMVDSSIYSDIGKGGHPYLTGLAITCGVVYYGVEGALFGPLWLCLLFIIMNMCTEMDGNIISITP
ncbi:uncharacterized protein LOC124489944 isoform X2 [Dermatophagoides farinae]|uniref:uncharacterized protein LOC124489944 isoform X2 n=1 Tax=Dermatophagoides farinae TaxID=6954 RepID=UPI003F63F62A